VGLGWTRERTQQFIENPTNFTLKDFKITLEITSEDINDLFTIDESEKEPTRVKHNFLSLMIISKSLESWQRISLDAFTSTTPIFNFFSEHFSKVKIKNTIKIIFLLLLVFILFFQNTEFSEHLRKEIVSIYTGCWIGAYYGYIGSIHASETVIFYNPTTKKIVEDNTRFYVNVLLADEQSQIYFYPPSIWERIGPSLQPGVLLFCTDSLSNITHGMITNGYVYAKSPYYKAPFFLTFKTNHSVESNFLTFNNFLIPNSYGRILSMLSYDDDSDKFVVEFKSDIYLPYQNTLSLNSVLEFQIFDSKKKQVQFLDLSQLYIYIEVL